MTFSPATLQKLRSLLCAMQIYIRDRVIAARDKSGAKLAGVSGVTAADTIYLIDRVSEEAICEWCAAHWPKTLPVELVMEGAEDRPEALTFPVGTPVKRTVLRCLIDPIDGTRGLMHDKRSGWVLGALAPQLGKKTNLGHILLAAMTEIPSSRAWRSDQLSALRGGPLEAKVFDLVRGTVGRFRPQTSKASDLNHGFASVAKFFPAAKVLLCQFEVALWERLGLMQEKASPLIFDDQYISTGGQLYELISGRDRLVIDPRPAAYAKLGLPEQLVCHPYDICTALLLNAAGGFVEQPTGKKLCAPLDTTSAVSWVGYANPALARKVRPVLRELYRDFFA